MEKIMTEAQTQAQNSAKNWLKIAKTSIYLLVFLLPLFFLPFTTDVLQFNKQALLIVLVFISLFAWLLKSLIEEKISFDTSIFNLPVVVFLVVLALATVFSASAYGSFWGWPLSVSASFLTNLGLALLYFLVLNLFRGKEEIFGLIFILIASGLLVTLLSLPQILGKFWLPFDFAGANSFNPIGTVNGLGIFLAVLLPLAVTSMFVLKGRLVKLLVSAFIILSLFLLLAINFWVAWVVLLVGVSLILIFGIARREIFNFSWLFLPTLLLAISLFTLVLRTPLMPVLNLPAEVSPTLNTSTTITVSAIKGSRPPVSWLFGSGPGTFVYDYSRFKPKEINQSVFWGVRFGSATSEVIDKLATTGLLGLLSFLAVVTTAVFFGLKTLMARGISRQQNYGWILLIGAFASFLGIVVGFFLYSINLSLAFLFWLLLASIFGLTPNKTRTLELQPPLMGERGETKETKGTREKFGISAAVLVSFIFIFVLITSLGIFFLGAQRYLAEVNYLKGMRALGQGDTVKAVDRVLMATRLTGGGQDNYWRDLSQIYLFRINEELQKKDISREELSQRVSNLINLAIAAGRSATDTGPKNVANWTVRGFNYANLLSLVAGADEWAIKSYEEALKLEPTNPYILTEIGRVYLARADNLSQEKEKAAERTAALNTGRENFQKALDLKSDYAPARFQLAMIDVREEKIKDAIEKLEATKTIVPFDTGLAFQLGLIYRADNQIDKARQEFERAVTLDPNYANARYFLGLIYDSQGQKDKAISQFEEIAKLNPDSEDIKKVLDNLRSGKSALEGIVPSQPPIEEKPPERLSVPETKSVAPAPSEVKPKTKP